MAERWREELKHVGWGYEIDVDIFPRYCCVLVVYKWPGLYDQPMNNKFHPAGS